MKYKASKKLISNQNLSLIHVIFAGFVCNWKYLIQQFVFNVNQTKFKNNNKIFYWFL